MTWEPVALTDVILGVGEAALDVGIPTNVWANREPRMTRVSFLMP